MAELWRHTCHCTLHNVNNILFSCSHTSEFLANGQHVHAQFKKDQLRLQHNDVFIDSKGKDKKRESKRTTWTNHNLKNQSTNETEGPVPDKLHPDSHHWVGR